MIIAAISRFLIMEIKYMLKNKKNLFIILFGIVAEIVVCVLYYLGFIQNIDSTTLIVAAIAALALLVMNCLKHCGRAITLCLLSFLLLVGVGKLGVMTEYSVTYANAMINNIKTVNNILESDNYHRVMTYGDKEYYVDNGYTYLYEIEKTKFGYNVAANSITIREDIESQINLYACEFYSLETIQAFSNMTQDKVAISFINGVADNGVIVKMISPSNKVFYSYIEMENTRSFVESLGISDLLFTIGRSNFYLTKPSKIIDGTASGDEIDFIDGQQYLLTENGKLSASPIVYIEFEEDSTYYNRVNYYIYREYFEQLKEYEDGLATMIPDSEEYKTMASQIESLKNSMSSYTCELAYEQISGQSTIRLYRAFVMDGEVTEVPKISVIEIYKDGKYIYAYTDMEMEDLY
jgi:hypothetical protein